MLTPLLPSTVIVEASAWWHLPAGLSLATEPPQYQERRRRWGVHRARYTRNSMHSRVSILKRPSHER